VDYGKLLNKAWTTVWNNKFLIGLGILASLGQGGGSSGSSYNFGNQGGSGRPSGPNNFTPPDFSPNFGPQFEQAMRDTGPVIIALIIAFFCIALIIGIALWVLSRTAQGGLINSVNTIDSGGVSGFGIAFRAGWEKIGRMLLISLVAALPGFILLIALVAMIIGVASSGGGQALQQATRSGDPARLAAAISANIGILLGLAALCCPLVLVSWIMSAVVTFADRACVLEDKGVIESFQRGFQVLRDNIGPAIILFLIQIGIGIGLSSVLFLPSLMIAFCCILWPLLWVVSGAIETYFSTVWTLAWREWTVSVSPTGEPIVPMSPPA